MKSHKLVNKIIKPLRVQLREDQPLVLLEEEFGFRSWIWIPDCSEKELITWWKSRLNLGKFYFDPKSLNHSKNSKIFNVFYRHSYYDNNRKKVYYNTPYALISVYNQLNNMNNTFKAHIFDDTDSWLKTPSGQYIFHIGAYYANLILKEEIQYLRSIINDK